MSERCYTIAFDPATPARALLGTRPGGLWESLDGGVTWAPMPTAIASTLSHGVNNGGIAPHPRVPGLWYVGHEKLGAFRSRDNGRSWTLINQGMEHYKDRHGICFTFDLKDDGTAYYGADGGLFKSTDFGDHWVRCTNGLPKGLYNGKRGNTTVCRMATHPKTGAIYAVFYAVGDGDVPGVYRSTDHGQTWACVNRNFPGGNRWAFDLQLAPTNPDVIYAATTSLLISSSDGGERWQKCPTVQNPRALAIHPKEANIVVASDTRRVWITRDGGTHWAEVTHDVGQHSGNDPKLIPDTELLAFDPAGSRVFAVTTAGVWVAEIGDLKP